MPPKEGKSLYVIVSYGFDYDDNTYSQSEYSDPYEIYENATDANARCDELNVEELKGKELREYSYELTDLTSTPEAVLIWFAKHKIGKENLIVPRNASKKDLIELYNMLNIQFYTVRDIPYIEFEEPKKAVKETHRFAKLGKE